VPRSAAALALAAAAALLAGGGSARTSTTATISHAPFVSAGVGTQTSSNWSGYVVAEAESGVTPTTFSAVAGSWVQPAATCAAGGTAYSAFWVGLGGFADDSEALEQTGTEADCTVGGTPRYSVWYELVPAPPVTVKLVVRPRDVISASVAVRGRTVTMKVRNLTRHTSFAKKLKLSAPDLGSAEWIAEAPSTCGLTGCRLLPLANFGTVSFSGGTAIGAAHHGTISDPAWAATAVTLEGSADAFRGRFVGTSPVADAVPSELGSDGTSFSVAWQEHQDAP